MLRLSMRLQAVADYVTYGNRVADVGTDHGYVPIYLVQHGIVPSAIAMDVKRGPLERAKEHICQSGLDGRIQSRLSDGLVQLQPGEADSVIIAGMGGMLTIRIIEQSFLKLDGVQELILEPQSDIAKVRAFLRSKGFWIDKENLILEAGKYYPVLHVVHASDQDVLNEDVLNEDVLNEDVLNEDVLNEDVLNEDVLAQMCAFVSDKTMARDLADQYGTYLIRERNPVLLQLLERDAGQKEKILQSVQGCDGQEQRMQEVEQSLKAIRGLIRMMTEREKSIEV